MPLMFMLDNKTDHNCAIIGTSFPSKENPGGGGEWPPVKIEPESLLLSRQDTQPLGHRHIQMVCSLLQLTNPYSVFFYLTVVVSISSTTQA